MNKIALKQNEISLKAKISATGLAVISAIILPQVFHIFGIALNVGTSLGEMFLPMHLPVMLAGLFAGPLAGALTGLLSPLLSFLFTQMPSINMLSFMMIELSVYGLAAGLLRNSKMPCTLKVLLTQVSGRAVRAIAILVAVLGFKSSAVSIAVIYKSITAGILGIILQLILIPLVFYRKENK